MIESPTARHCYRLECTLLLQSLQYLDKPSTSTYKNAVVEVGRNQERRLVLSLELGKSRKGDLPNVSYLLQDVKVHHKFAASKGKGCLDIPEKKLQVFLSNCPPQKLNVFLKTIEAKLALLNSLGTPKHLSGREAGFDVPRIFAELSPLTLVEIKKLRPALAEVSNTKKSSETPKRRRFNSPAKPKSVSSGVVDPVELSEEQKCVVRAVMSKKSVFFTGSAGTGKSLVLRKLLGLLPPDSTFVTAATGVAACQIGGITLHSFAGIGSGAADVNRCLEMAQRPSVAGQWRKCSHLIVDEISMVDADFFTKLNIVAQHVRGRKVPFGGIQLILCGDFHQLPPVSKAGAETKFCFQSKSWADAVQCCVMLRTIHRQSDHKFINILQEVREGRCSQESFGILESTKRNSVSNGDIIATKLCTHKSDVNLINNTQLSLLDGKEEVFSAVDSEALPWNMCENLCPATLKLKVGAQVMLTKNLDLAKGLSNGSRGVVIGFKTYPLVKFASGHEVLVKPERFFMKLSGANGSGSNASRVQLPLRLAWAISIHKSQGMSLDRVEVSLSRVFEYGQAYVALSRARSLDGLRVRELNRNCVRAHPQVLDFYQKLNDRPAMKRQRLSDHF